MMTKQEIDKLRGLSNRVGTQAAANMIGIHRTSLIALLAGEAIRPVTEQVVRAALDGGVVERSPGQDIVRGERRGNSPTTKRKA